MGQVSIYLFTIPSCLYFIKSLLLLLSESYAESHSATGCKAAKRRYMRRAWAAASEGGKAR